FCAIDETCAKITASFSLTACTSLDGEPVPTCGEVLILNSPLSTLNSQLPRYYTLKGISLGTQKPTTPGIYIEARGVKARKIIVR
ncbi:MAG: hypothetical protein FWC26_08485, partial [Fibromonadales bacterium]|nr:hypothetical protein [Fibromonadales bacterium]